MANIDVKTLGAAIGASGGGSGSDKVFIATYGTSTASEVAAALTAGKMVACKYTRSSVEIHWLYLVDETDGKYAFAESMVTTSNGTTTVVGLSAALNKSTNAWELVEGSSNIPTNVLLYTAQTLTDAQKAQALKNLDGVRIIKLEDATLTLAELTSMLSTINTNGEHVFFDVAALSYPLYLCTISITYNGSTPSVYRLNDLVSGRLSMGAYDGTKTLGTILSEAVEDYVTLTITCNTQDGVTVTGQTVTIRNGDSASSPVYKTLAYEGQPLSLIVPKNFIYYCSVSDTLSGHFNPSTAQGVATTNTSVTLTYNDTAHLTSYADVKAAVNAGAGATLIGTEISDTYTDNGTVYDDPAIIVDVRTVYDTDGETHSAAIMQRKYATADAVQFDAPETEVATGTYEDELSYYVSDASAASTFKLLVKGTDYNVGDTITGTVYKNAISDSTGYICKYGYNRYKDSAQRQWLNSEEDSWWTAQHTGDSAPTQANTVKGYLAGCSAALKQYAKAIRITCYTNSVTDGSVVDTLVDKIWLPSGTEMYGSVNANEGTYFPYWKTKTGLTEPSNSANDNRKIFSIKNHSSAQTVRLRSATRSNSYYAWFVYASGNLSTGNSSNSCASAPAFAIY